MRAPFFVAKSSETILRWTMLFLKSNLLETELLTKVQRDLCCSYKQSSNWTTLAATSSKPLVWPHLPASKLQKHDRAIPLCFGAVPSTEPLVGALESCSPHGSFRALWEAHRRNLTHHPPKMAHPVPIWDISKVCNELCCWGRYQASGKSVQPKGSF